MTTTRETAQAWGLSGLKLIAAMNIVPVAAVVVRLPGYEGGIPAWLAGPLAGYGLGAGLATLAMGAAFGSLRFLDRAECGQDVTVQLPDLRKSDKLMFAASALTAGAIVAFTLSTLLLAATGRA